jgi:hypothetical protein
LLTSSLLVFVGCPTQGNQLINRMCCFVGLFCTRLQAFALGLLDRGFVNCVSNLKAVVRVALGDGGGAGGARLDSVCIWPGS